MTTTLATLGVGFLLLALGVILMLVPLGVHFGFRAPRVAAQATPADHGLPFETVRIPTARGRFLAGWLISPPTAETGWRSRCSVLMVHGWGSNAAQILPIAAPLVRAGFHLLLFDARNHGNSDGDTFSSLPRFAEDLEHGIDWLRREHPARSRGLAVIGHSVGAGAVLLTATRNPAIDAAISISAFAHPREVTERFMAHLPLPKLAVSVVARYVEWLIGYRFDRIAPLNTIRRARCPVLLVHGTADRTVPLSDAHRIYRNRIDDQVRFLAIPDAGHDSTDRVERHADELLAFLDATLKPLAQRRGPKRPAKATA